MRFAEMHRFCRVTTSYKSTAGEPVDVYHYNGLEYGNFLPRPNDVRVKSLSETGFIKKPFLVSMHSKPCLQDLAPVSE